MILDDLARETLNVEYVHSKIRVYSPFGKKLKEGLKTYHTQNIEGLSLAYDRLEKLVKAIDKKGHVFSELREKFKKVMTLDQSFSRIEKDQVLTVTEFFEIKTFLFLLIEIEALINKADVELPKRYQVHRIEVLEKLLDPNDYQVKSFYVYDNYSKKLSNIRKNLKEETVKKDKAYKKIIEDLQKDYSLKIKRSGEIVVDKNNKKLIEKFEADQRVYYQNENIMSVIFSIKSSELLEDYIQRIDHLKVLEEKEVDKIRKDLTVRIKSELGLLIDNYESIGYLDLLMGKAYFSLAFNGVKPEIRENPSLRIIDGRHIIVEENLRQKKKEYIPISIETAPGVTLITGANMGGKTVSLKMIGLLFYIAQLGLFVPAKSFSFHPIGFIRTSIGDAQDIHKGLSSFGAEIEVIKVATLMNGFGLLLVDELARGTNPVEGYALSKGIIDFFKKKEMMSIISTHFDGLADDDLKHYQVKGLKEINDAIDVETIDEHMDYRLIPVQSNKTVPKDALNIAKLLGLKDEILRSAEKYLLKGSEGSGK
jgi:DNA mismatch repair ATPase MutS